MATNSPVVFSLLFLALCAGCNCQDQARPRISSSSLLQNISTQLTLQCNPAPGCDAYNSELIFSQNGHVMYNSTLKRGNLPTRINATAIRLPIPNLLQPNLTCAYNNSLSSNSLDIPYLSIDEFQVNPIQFKYNQSSTISCKVTLIQDPNNFTVRFLFNRVSHFEFKNSNGEINWFNLANSDFRNKIELKQAGHLVVSEYQELYSAIFAIDVTLIESNGYDSRYETEISNLLFPIQCELQYGDNKLMTHQSKKYYN